MRPVGRMKFHKGALGEWGKRSGRVTRKRKVSGRAGLNDRLTDFVSAPAGGKCSQAAPLPDCQLPIFFRFEPQLAAGGVDVMAFFPA